VNSLECKIKGILLGIQTAIEHTNKPPSSTFSNAVYILCDSAAATELESVHGHGRGIRWPHNIQNLVLLHSQLST